MRFYSIQITDSAGLPINLGNTTLAPATFTSFLQGTGHYTPGYSGLTDPGALNIEMDIPVVSEEIPSGQGYLKIWGVSLDMVNHASKLNYQNITIYAGFQKGLPLADAQLLASPLRNGIIFKGSIYQAFGNWQGNEQTIEMFLGPQLMPNAVPKDKTPIVLNCPQGAVLGSAIENALTIAGFGVSSVNISPSLTMMPQPCMGKYDNIFDFATDINQLSKDALSAYPKYAGIKILRNQPNAISKVPILTVTDNWVPSADAPILINFMDMIGQPVWLDFNTLQFKLMMRSDISIGKTVIMPQNYAINTAQSQSQIKNNIAYTKTAYVSAVRYIGNFRHETGDSWITIIDVLPNQAAISR